MIESPVSIPSRGVNLQGICHAPLKGNGTAVILCHGFTGNKQENKRLFVETGRALANNGFWGLRFDFFGSGDSPGEFRESRLSINIQNLLDAIKTVRGFGFQRIVVLGISFGAATAILAFEKEPVDGLVLWSTVPDTRELFEAKLGMPLEQAPVQDIYEYDGWLIERDFYLDALRYDIRAHFQKIDVPKLLVQGTGDEAVFVKGFEMFRQLAREPAEFHLIPESGHTYQTPRHRQEVIERTLAWLKKYFDSKV